MLCSLSFFSLHHSQVYVGCDVTAYVLECFGQLISADGPLSPSQVDVSREDRSVCMMCVGGADNENLCCHIVLIRLLPDICNYGPII